MLPPVCPLCRIAIPPVDDVCPRDGHPGREVAWIAVPETLSQRFSVIEPFASGQGGSLYIADEPETGRRGLLKVLAPCSNQPAERQRLRRELVKQATLTRTHLLVPLASGESEGFTWVFREWLDGVSLDVRLSREGALQQTEALAIAAQIATALDELHRGGLLHRDVKPGHIFLQPTPNGIPRALLIDAGVTSLLSARVHGAAGDAAAPIFGTAGYVAPEQLLGKLVSFRSDLYSLGCVLYRMLTGRPAFAGDTLEQTLAAQRQGELPPTPADLPNGIGALLHSILAKDPQQRPFSAQKLRRTLDPFLPDGALMEKQPTTTFETVPQPSPSVAPQPSGTLKPPAHPSARLSMPAPPEAALRPRMSSAPPPAPPSAHRPREENTQQIDIAQLQEIAQPKRAASVPPPTPHSKSSMPPPVPGSAKASMPPAQQQVSDKTQPIRLDQILAVAAARKSVNAPPSAPKLAPEPAPAPAPAPEPAEEPKLIEDESTGVFHPRLIAGAPSVQQAIEEDDEPLSEPPRGALFTAQDEPFSAPSPSELPGRAGPALFQPAAPATRPAAASVPPPAVRAKPVATLPPPVRAASAFAPTMLGGQAPPAPAPKREESSAEVAAEGFAKATLMGIGVDPLAPEVPFAPTQAPRVDSSFELPTMELRKDEADGQERDHPTERVPLINSSFAPPSLDDAFEHGYSPAGSIPSGTLGASSGQQNDSRRLLMYASAAVVGLAVLAVGASALRGKPEPVASPSYAAVPALPAGAAVAPVAKAEPVQAQRPTVESLKPSTSAMAPSVQPVPTTAAAPAAQLAPAEPAAKLAPVTTPVAVVEPIKQAPVLAAEEPERTRESASAIRHEKRAAARAEREAAKSAKVSKSSASEKKPTDKAALFAAARDEARAAYSAKKYKDAAAAYEKASRYDPKHAGTYAGLGAARLQLGDNKGAVAAYKRAVELSPETSGFHAALGRAYLANGDKSKATAEYKKALSLDPGNEAAKLAIKQI